MGSAAQPKPSQEDMARNVKMSDQDEVDEVDVVDEVDASPTEFKAEHALEPDISTSTWAWG